MPVPPASGGTCGAQRPSCAHLVAQPARRVLRRLRPRRSIAGSFGSDALGHERAHLLEPFGGRRPCGGGHGVSIAGDEARLLHGLRAAGHEPARAARAGARGGATRLRLGVGGGGVGRRRDHAARVARRADATAEARHRDHAAAGPLAGERGDDCGDARPALGRPVPDGPRHVGPAGRRGLARAGVGEAAREDARVRRDRARDRAARAARASRRALRHPGPGRHRSRQAAEADGASAARGDPDLPRGDRAEGGRAGVRDRRRLAADLLVARAGAHRVPARPRARGIRHRAVRAGDRHRRRRGGPRRC